MDAPPIPLKFLRFTVKHMDSWERLKEENERLRRLVAMLAGLVDNEAFTLMKAAREALQILKQVRGEGG